MDSIQVTGIRAYGYTGALPEERVLGQWFEVSLTLWLDLALAADTDQLADTYNYCQAIDQVQRLIRTQRFSLLEALAAAISRATLSGDERLQQVRVQLVKLAAPIPDFDGRIAVDMTRDRTFLRSHT
ncbi:putative dihydroneopterin aldolase [Halomicronema hongdechloris C2206]|uniref:7,8-dihydroneopterin aldolase n=1 Tax=Halomicronema hongdechloris C2206 TaxID=1641165 RepID=A0A1Z3HQT9_9CYAN|nr:dihydroneopterin aldolase [Halomicronema hongdechloris]ASC72680.1 putative dihydroneopterin aldolase [Halomicronema hongdechloris C2206]